MENDGKQQPQQNSKVNSTYSFLSNYILFMKLSYIQYYASQYILLMEIIDRVQTMKSVYMELENTLEELRCMS